MTAERWVGVNEGSVAWADAAHDILTEVAGHHLAVITRADLAEQVQSRTGLRTRSPYRTWIGSVLAIVVTRAHAEALPPLTSLVVHRAGGDVETEEGVTQARFACYRRYADDIPAEVIALADAEVRAKEAEAAEATRARRTRSSSAGTRAPRTRKPVVPEEAPKICPTCFVQLPASGICDDCG
ncbi:hypothetical protein OCAE111667_26835 [Occultella aeris]|uniref:Uncharacterized protein n=1 Tax=Occultella aeris TaxID=2761496 RepID=A0A7M4DF35_9MICO|nr:hypothetical protein [Occultella aeris]VZO35528.1 hypothetical protein HALOF300_00726 [Occultella aeris]